MANENIGEVRCPFGPGVTAFVRKAQKGKFPLYLSSSYAGLLFLKTEQGQEWIRQNARFYETAEAGAAAQPASEGESAQGQEVEQAKDKPKGWELDDL